MSLRIDKIVPGNLVFHTHPDTDIVSLTTLDTRYIKVAGGNSAANIIIENDYQDGDISFKVNDGGVDKTVMTLDGATGNVGIGTTNPSQKLHIDGNLRLTGAFYDSSNQAGLTGNILQSTGVGTSWTSLSSLSVGNADTLDNLDSLQFLRSDTSDNYTSGTLTFNSATELDIASGATLDINGNLTIADTDITLDGASTNLTTTGNFSVNTSQLFVNKTSGNVGIGTTGPGEKLEVNGSILLPTSGILKISTRGSIYSWSRSPDEGLIYLAPGRTGGWYGTHDFYTGYSGGAATVAMRIKNGNVGIGTTSPSQQLEITGDFKIPNTTYADQSGIIYKGADRFIHNFNYGNNGTVTTNGGNTFVGVNAGNFTMGSTATLTYHSSYNTAIGTNALSSNTTGHANLANGYQTLRYNTTGSNNTAIGTNALYTNTTGYSNTANGASTLFSNTTGSYNTANGHAALYTNTTGFYNTADGSYALYANTTGYNNTANGYQTLRYNTTGYNNIANGVNALYNVKPTSKAITAFADYGTTAPGTVKATSAGHGLSGTVANIRISGTTNYNGLYTITVIDVDNFYFTDTWVANDATGWWGKDTEGRNNIGIGYGAGDNITTGSNNLIIGYNVDAPLATGDNQLNIGNAIYGNLSSGNVGIGTTSPGYKLDVTHNGSLQGIVTQTDNNNWNEIGVWSGTSDDVKVQIHAQNGVATPIKIGSRTNTQVAFTVFDSPKMVINTSGNVGIGVTDPDTMLEVFGSTGLKISFDATDNTTLVTDTNGDLTITPSGDEVILPTGKNLKLGDTVLTEQNVIDLLALLA
ncbi:MAG: hypothetical protein BWY29_00945 [Microgenomates group bacterium ADurb.Bin238]|nr:MAG: hypothetical protein BWY29_00945 [Microgenomates group bacterium ADurb.Bin238]